MENPKDAIRKLLELISEHGKVSGYKINIWKSLASIYENHQKIQGELCHSTALAFFKAVHKK